MARRFVCIWFRYLKADWVKLQRPQLRNKPFVLATPDHGRLVVTAGCPLTEREGITPGMAVADARAIIPSLQVINDKAGLSLKLLKKNAGLCIRFTPVVGIHLPDTLVLDASGCAHLWGKEPDYLTVIHNRFTSAGYHVQLAMADTLGAAWGFAHFGDNGSIVPEKRQADFLLPLPPHALRLEKEQLDLLQKCGLYKIRDFLGMPRSVMKRRFGELFINRIDQALGFVEEPVEPVFPVEPFQERLPSLEPIVTAKGIEIALQQLLDTVCARLSLQQKGLRKALFRCYRIDNQVETVEIGTNRPSKDPEHLFRLFGDRIATIEPALGIEVFVLEARQIEDLSFPQTTLWENNNRISDQRIAELLDRLGGRLGMETIHRYLPDEHYWPERSYKTASSLAEEPVTRWNLDRPRPLLLLPKPEPVEVTAPIPDYPPMLFRHKGVLHRVLKADGPERIEQEWWLEAGKHRDYYAVEDELGKRYWLFRSGHYDAEKTYRWFLHGYFP